MFEVCNSSRARQEMARDKWRKRSSVLKVAVRALQKGFYRYGRPFSPRGHISNKGFEEDGGRGMVPGDVKEGHFAVVAVRGDGESRRFVVSLSCLSHPTFLRLLERAEEEFGFCQEGALAIPCRPSELERILMEL